MKERKKETAYERDEGKRKRNTAALANEVCQIEKKKASRRNQ